MSRTMKLTPALLRKIVLEEKARMMREAAGVDPIASGKAHPSDIKPSEVDADGYAETLEKDIDHIKVLKIKEARLARQLRKIQETKRLLRARVNRNIG
jgi:hypothetical protein